MITRGSWFLLKNSSKRICKSAVKLIELDDPGYRLPLLPNFHTNSEGPFVNFGLRGGAGVFSQKMSVKNVEYLQKK